MDFISRPYAIFPIKGVQTGGAYGGTVREGLAPIQRLNPTNYGASGSNGGRSYREYGKSHTSKGNAWGYLATRSKTWLIGN